MSNSHDLAFYLSRLADSVWLSDPVVPGEQCLLSSSLNQKNGPRDCNYFLRDETDDAGTTWHVLVDFAGPGCITRFWTGGRFDGDLEIWLDDEPTPRYNTTINTFFSGELEHFTPPLVLDSPASSEGRVSYMPIPFAKRCVIRSSSQSTSFYWQINALRYGGETGVETMPRALGSQERALLGKVAKTWNTPEPENLTWQQGTCPAGQYVNLYTNEKPGTINLLAFDTGSAKTENLKNLRLQVRWDHEKRTAVDVSLADLAFQRSAPAKADSLFVQSDHEHVTCTLPMPFTACKIELINEGPESIAFKWALNINPATSPSPMRLNAQTNQRRLPYGLPIQLINTQGAGRLIGLYLTTEQLPPVKSVPYFNQEGNEYIYVDDDKDPSWIGTGTEDYFNCSYYYDRGKVSTPTHGCVDLRQDVGGSANAGIVGAYRWHILDSVPYSQRLLMILEAGCPKKGAISGVNGCEMLDYGWTAFWYSDPDTKSATGAEDLSL